jgi:hypothetical protein
MKIERKNMKKPLCLLLLILLAGVTACTQTTTSTEPLPYAHPFPDWTFMRNVQIDEATLRLLKSPSTRLIYLDDEMVVSYQSIPQSALVEVDYLDVKKTFQTTTYDPFVFQYDSINEVLYFSDSSPSTEYKFIRTVPSSVEQADHWYWHKSGAIQYVNSQFLVINNEIRTFRGEILSSVHDTLGFVPKRIGDPIRFYSYQSNEEVTSGCTVYIHNGFDTEPVAIPVDSEYTCTQDFKASVDDLLVPLYDRQIRGFATIAKDGTVRKFILADEIDDYGSFVLDSLKYYGSVIHFEYRDSSNQPHRISLNTEFSDFAIDESDSSLAQGTRYWDHEIRFFRDYNGQYQLFKNGMLIYSYPMMFPPFGIIQFVKVGNFAVIIETSTDNLGGKLTRINLTDGSQIVHEFDDLPFVTGNMTTLLFESEGCIRLYDILENTFAETPLTGTIRSVADNVVLSYTDTKVSLYNLSTGVYVETSRISHLVYYYHAPHAFLVEYQGYYYWIG